MRDDADLAGAERRVRLDAVDERRAARGRGEQLLERDDPRPLARDDVERAQRLGVRERLGGREVVALLQDLQMFRRGDENRGGHRKSV